jgi:hypothetical protein
MFDPAERPVNRSQQTAAGLMQAYLKIRFGVGVCLVDWIAFPTTRSRDQTSGVGVADRQFSPFFQQCSLVSIQFSSIHR